jgi:predicted aldo/keto reductase-like oxidoreductase
MAAAERGLAVFVMEPLLGGRLAGKLPPRARAVLDGARDPHLRTPAAWGLSWVWNHPQVTMLLSGMTDTAQVDENAALADRALPNSMTTEQLDTIARVLAEFEKSNRVPCTGCGYCMPCPKGINIPGCFAAYNASYAHSWFTGLSQYFTASAVRTSEPKLVSNCVKCGKCARHCPQHIDIPERLDDARRRFQPGPVTAALKVFSKTRSS